jgi:futalosine hydrolase
MRILIVTATVFELQPLLDELTVKDNQAVKHKGHELHFLHTGVGMTQTAYALTKELRSAYDLVLNAGIAGSFYRGIRVGEVVQVISDCMVEMGAEDDEEFIHFRDLNLPGKNTFSNSSHITTNTLDELKKVMGATVNKVHGNEHSISLLLKRFDVEVESMEGAAVALVCEQETVPYLQIRAVSNYVTRRDREAWDIPLAIKNLNTTLLNILNEIE